MGSDLINDRLNQVAGWHRGFVFLWYEKATPDCFCYFCGRYHDDDTNPLLVARFGESAHQFKWGDFYSFCLHQEECVLRETTTKFLKAVGR